MIEHVGELSKRAFDLTPAVVMRFRGKDGIEIGMFYCPYVPMTVQNALVVKKKQ